MPKPSYYEEEKLTKTELEVLKRCTYSVNETAKILGVSYTTIKTHRENLYGKLGVLNAAQAIVEGLKNKIITLEDLGG